MQPGDRSTVPTVEAAVRRAAHLGDPEQASDGVTALIQSFEDDERPASAAEGLRDELASAAREIDPDGRAPEVAVTAAVTHWLVTNPDADERPEAAIREATRLWFGEDVPEPVEDYLAGRGAG